MVAKKREWDFKTQMECTSIAQMWETVFVNGQLGKNQNGKNVMAINQIEKPTQKLDSCLVLGSVFLASRRKHFPFIDPFKLMFGWISCNAYRLSIFEHAIVMAKATARVLTD